MVTIGALIIRIGVWGPLYYNYNEEQNSIGNYLRHYSKVAVSVSLQGFMCQAWSNVGT